MQESSCIAGVDVAKAELVVSVDEGSTSVQHISNHAEAIAAWLRELPARSVVAMESSGPYHQLLAQMAHAAGMHVYVLNARDVHMYAKALSARGKTDRLDALVISRYVREHREHLRPWQPCAGVAELVQRVLERRSELTQQRVSIRQSLRFIEPLHSVADQLEQAFKQALEHIDGLLVALLAQEPKLDAAAQNLQSITGVGMQAGIRLAALFARIPFANANANANANAVVAYSGLDPRPNDSGTKRGRRRLSKRGPAGLRKQLYLVALAACRSKLMKPYYLKLREKFSSTESLVILARKLLRVAWAVWRAGKGFDPELFARENACKKP